MKALISVSVLALLSLAGQMFGFRKQAHFLLIIGLLAALGISLSDWGNNTSYFNNMLVADNYAIAFSGALLLLSTLVLLLAPRFYDSISIARTDSYAMKMFALAGGLCMVSFGNLSMLFIGIELLSISSYVLAGSDKRNLLSNEASLKYFIMGSFASAFLLFGIALVYAVTGTFDLALIGKYALAHAGTADPLFYAGILLLIVAMGFKVSAAPFHFWAPDVYDGSPTLITLFMATVGKVAAFGAFLRLFGNAFLPINDNITLILSLIAVLTMCVGNLSALWQDSFKRMLAYSGVAHAGYLLLGILADTKLADNAVLFYGIGYALSSVIAFAVLLLINYRTDSDSRSDFNGLAARNPLLSLVVAVAMLSLAGIPPTAGFFGKYYLFSMAINAGYTWVVAIAVINSIISVFYYFDIIIRMYVGSNSTQEALDIPMSYRIALGIALIGITVLGIYPSLLAGVL